MNTSQTTKGGTYINRHYNFGYRLQNKVESALKVTTRRSRRRKIYSSSAVVWEKAVQRLAHACQTDTAHPGCYYCARYCRVIR